MLIRPFFSLISHLLCSSSSDDWITGVSYKHEREILINTFESVGYWRRLYFGVSSLSFRIVTFSTLVDDPRIVGGSISRPFCSVLLIWFDILPLHIPSTVWFPTSTNCLCHHPLQPSNFESVILVWVTRHSRHCEDFILHYESLYLLNFVYSFHCAHICILSTVFFL